MLVISVRPAEPMGTIYSSGSITLVDGVPQRATSEPLRAFEVGQEFSPAGIANTIDGKVLYLIAIITHQHGAAQFPCGWYDSNLFRIVNPNIKNWVFRLIKNAYTASIILNERLANADLDEIQLPYDSLNEYYKQMFTPENLNAKLPKT
jgi:hypothetical protein